MLKKIQKLTAKRTSATAQIEAERAKATALFESIGEGAIATNENGRIERINPVATEILGFSTDDLMGQWFPKVIVAEDEDGQLINTIDRPISKAILQGKPVSAKLIYRRKDGSRIPVYTTVSPILLDGLPIGAMEVFRDITRDNEIERAKDEFVLLASHQLRTPATAVKQFLGLILEGFTRNKTEERKFIEDAYKSNEEQLAIVEDILNTAKIDAGQVRLQKERTDLVELVGYLVKEVKGTAKVRSQTLTFKAPSHEVWVMADKLKLNMVIGNLLTNAIKYTQEKGTIKVTVAVVKGKAIVSVADNGAGIAPHDLAKLFTKFGRIQNEATQRVQGTGLGLYLAKNFVELHGGKLEVTSKVNKGTTFSVKLSEEK